MTAIAPFPGQFQRLNRKPLLVNEVFPTLAAAQTYANSATAYPSQVIKIVTADVNEPIQRYEIQKDYSLKLMESGGGSSSLEETIVSAVDIGGIRAGDTITVGTLMTEVIQKLLAPEAHPSITSFTSTPAAFGLKEVGTAISSVNLSAVVTKGTANIESIQIIRAPNVVLINNDVSPNGGTITVTDSVGLSGGIREYRCVVTDENGLTATSEMAFKFVWPIFVGASNTKAITEAGLKALTHILTEEDEVEAELTTNKQYIVWAFPAGQEPSSIKDKNGLELILTFDTATVSVTLGAFVNNYTVFTSSYVSTISSYNLTIS